MGSSDCFMIQSCQPLHKTRYNHEWISETSCRTKLVVHFVQLVPVLHTKHILLKLSTTISPNWWHQIGGFCPGKGGCKAYQVQKRSGLKIRLPWNTHLPAPVGHFSTRLGLATPAIAMICLLSVCLDITCYKNQLNFFQENWNSNSPKQLFLRSCPANTDPVLVGGAWITNKYQKTMHHPKDWHETKSSTDKSDLSSDNLFKKKRHPQAI